MAGYRVAGERGRSAVSPDPASRVETDCGNRPQCEVGAERPAEADSEPPRQLRARAIPTCCADPAVVNAGIPHAATRFPGEPARGVQPEVIRVLYWY